MLFITNRTLNEGKISKADRKVTFSLGDTEAQQSVFFCQRSGSGKYTELTSGPFFAKLKAAKAEQILLYIHGFSNQPEPDVFPRAEALQELLDAANPGLVLVVPLIWPCDDDPGVLKDYWDDQKAADASAFAFARVFGKFMDWRGGAANVEVPCLKRINVLAHSMGNRVLREALSTVVRYDFPDGVPLLFRNTFLVAADIVNESLERSEGGQHICESARNVCVYFASDDLALRASKVANLKNKVASRRLGHTGPEDMSKVPANVYAVDCDNLNTKYDSPKGHSYFMYDEKGKGPGKVFEHIRTTIVDGRVPVGKDFKERQVVLK
ncbi:MAG: alpha/beta hydrolase [Planctomycetota bacterium]